MSMTCDNCSQPVSYHGISAGTDSYVELMTREDADHFASFEEGMEDYIPDSLQLCSTCAGLVFARDWSQLIERSLAV